MFCNKYRCKHPVQLRVRRKRVVGRRLRELGSKGADLRSQQAGK